MEAQEAAGTGSRPTPDQIVDMLNNLFLVPTLAARIAGHDGVWRADEEGGLPKGG